MDTTSKHSKPLGVLSHGRLPAPLFVTSSQSNSSVALNASQNSSTPTAKSGLPHIVTLNDNQFRRLQKNATKTSSDAVPSPYQHGATKNDKKFTAYYRDSKTRLAYAARSAAEAYNLKKFTETNVRREIVDSIAGTVAALVATVIVYPLDNIRTRISVSSRKQSNSPFQSLKNVVRYEGIGGLYRGLSTALIGVFVSWSTYNVSVSLLKSIANRRRGDVRNNNLESFLIRIIALFISVLVSTPVWLANTRITLYGYEHSSKSLIRIILKIYNEEGLRGIFAGLVPSLFLSVTPALQFAILGKLKSILHYSKQKKSRLPIVAAAPPFPIMPEMNFPNTTMNSPQFQLNTEITATEYIFIGLLSKVAASLLTYPYRVLRAHAQSKFSPSYANQLSIQYMLTMLENDGVRGLFKGFTSKLLADVISTTIMLIVYRKVLAILKIPVKRFSQQRTEKRPQ